MGDRALTAQMFTTAAQLLDLTDSQSVPTSPAYAFFTDPKKRRKVAPGPS